MIEIEKIESLFGKPWGDEFAPHLKHNFVLRSNRMGCGYCPNDFEVTRDKNYNYFTLHILFSGCSLFNIAGKEFLLKKGDAFIITAGEEHRYCNYENSKLGYIWIEFEGESCKGLINFFKHNGIRYIDSQNTDKMAEKLVEILQYVKQTKDINLFELSAMQYALEMYLLEAINEQPQNTMPVIVAQAFEYLSANFASEVQITELAKTLHVSHTYLTREFKRCVGVSPRQYLVLKRVEHACMLLDTTDYPCSQIAIECGFYDATHFHRTFAKMMQKTPRSYRKRATRGK